MSGATSLATMKRARRRKGAKNASAEEIEHLHDGAEGDTTQDAVLWELGEASDDEDGEVPEGYRSPRQPTSSSDPTAGGERARMLEDREDDDDEENRASVSSDATLAHPAGEPPAPYRDDEFGDWGEAERKSTSAA